MKESAFKLALIIARRESRLNQLNQSLEPYETGQITQWLEQGFVENLQSGYNHILSGREGNEVLEALPEAKRFVEEESKREEFIQENTLTVRLIEFLIQLSSCQEDGVSLPEDSIPTPSEMDLVDDPRTYEAFQNFVLELRHPKSQRVCEALLVILSCIKTDALYPDPDLPPPPQFPDFD